MRVFPRIRLRGLGARGVLRRRPSRRGGAGRPLLTPEVLLPAGPLLLLAGSCMAYAGLPGARAGFVVLAVSAVMVAAAQGFALRRALLRTSLRLSHGGGDDRRFLLDLSGSVRAAASVEQLYEQVAERVMNEFRVEGVSVFIRDDVTGEFVCRVCPRAAPREGTPRGVAAPREQDVHAAHDERLALDGDSFVVRRLRHLDSPLGVGPEGFDLWLKGTPPSAREAREREVSVLRRVGARLLVQVKTRGRLTGVLSLGRRAGGGVLSPDEKLLLGSIAGQLALIVENSKLLERMVEEERLRRELQMAAEVQRRLFPEAPPASPFIELAGYCQPARKVGGDYYDFLAFASGQTGVVVADVAGKGISAALLMSTLQASLRAQVAACELDASHEGALSGLVSTLNGLLCRSTGPASYVTFFYAQFDARTHALSYVNAGHNPPLLFRASGGALRRAPERGTAAGSCAPLRLDEGGPVLGLFEGCGYEQGMVRMRAGDVLVGYTDGVVEALNGQALEFGESRLQEAVSASAAMSAQEICDRVIDSIGDWCAGTPQHDDLTLVVLKVTRAPADV